jgi:branched-chain amino acid transport system permease protein
MLQGGLLALLALVAVGFSLVWGVMNIINLAHGAFVLIGAYVQRLVVNLVVNAPICITLLLTFGIELLLVNGLILMFSANYRSISTGYASQGVALGAAVRAPVGRLLAFAVAVALTIALVALMSRTRTAFILGAIVIVAVLLLPEGAVSFISASWRDRRLSLLDNVRRYRL